MSSSSEDQEETPERDWYEPIPCSVSRDECFWDSFISLDVNEGLSVDLSERYMEREIQKEKKNISLNIDSYIRNTKMYNKTVPYYKYVIGRLKTRYLTAPHFTLGLEQDTDGYEHIIINEAPFTPVYVALCTGGNTEEYENHANRYKALIDKEMVLNDFHFRAVKPNAEYVIPENTVYFVYTVTHSKFMLECAEPGTSDSYDSTASDTEESLADAGPSSRRQKTVGTSWKKEKKSLEMEIRGLKKKIKEQDRDLEKHKRQESALRKKIASLSSQVAELKDKLKQAKNALKL